MDNDETRMKPKPKLKSSCRRDEDDSKGLVFMWEGYKSVSPGSFDIFNGVTIQKAAAGARHCLFLSIDGLLYAYGNNQHGQLGLGTFRDCMEEPRVIESLTEKVIDMSCGAKHSAAVSYGGLVLSWGDSTEGQCGLPQLHKYPSPEYVTITQAESPVCGSGHHSPNHLPVVMEQVSCGARHTAALSEDGEVWTWGSGVQLGLSNVDKAPTPTRVEFLVGRKVLKVCCAANHTLALVQKETSLNKTAAGHRGSRTHKPTRRSLSREEKSGSQSPVANNVQRHRLKPATCVRCDGEIYSYAESEDSLIITDKHTCPLGLEVTDQKPADVSQSPRKLSSATSEYQPLNPTESHRSPAEPTDSSPSLTGSIAEQQSISSISTDAAGVEALPGNPTFIESQETATSSQSTHSTSIRHGSPAPPPLPDGVALRRWQSSPVSELHIDTSDAHQDAADSANPMQRSQSFSPHSNLRKSRSAFLDETEAKEFLQKQLRGEDDKSTGQSTSTPPGSPFVKKIQENFLQYMPTAPAMQEYMSNLTKTVVSNIKTSIDKFGFPSTAEEPDELSLVRQRMGSVDEEEYHLAWRHFDRHGSMPRSASMGLPGLKQMGQHSRQGSLPGGLNMMGCPENLTKITRPEIVLNTDVWSWGRGHKGQLGHGDLLDRSQPCRLKVLTDKRVVKIACGGNHSLALTASCQLYTWGDNTYLQLGHQDPAGTTSPQKVQTLVGASIWDISAGDQHTLLLADGATFCPEVYYTGKQPGEALEPDLQVRPPSRSLCNRIGSLRKLGWNHCVVAGGDTCLALANKNASGSVATLHAFSSTERHFYGQLDRIAHLLKAFVHSEWFKNTETTDLESCVQMLVEAFLLLGDMVAVNHLEWTQVIKGNLDLYSVQLLSKPDQCIARLQHYSKCFADLLAMGGFELCTRKFSAFFDKVQGKLVEMLEGHRLNSDSTGMMFKRILQIPFLRLKEYHRLIGKVALQYPAYTREHAHLHQIAQEWDTLKQAATAEHNMAEQSKAFWESCPLRLAESLRSPARRLIKESKQHPITLHAAGRFSTHTFLLFSDIFVHAQYSSHQSYHLATVWLESVQNSESLKNGLIITTPEDKLTLSTPTASDKAEWLWGLNQAIDKLLSHHKNLSRPFVSSGSLYPPRDRQASHIFTKHSTLKDARYHGMWRDGKMHGHGELSWPDGRKYIGKFVDGQQDGCGVYTITKEDGLKEVHKGQWKAGKMDGMGLIRYANGDVYEGHFKDGKKHGQGVLKQGKFNSPVASIYMGEWSNDKRNGYGVYDDILKGEKYMGQWLDGNRHGSGIIVTLDGMYFEGSFNNNKFMGTGLLVTEDNTYYEGEFTGGPNLYGKGTLTMPNGDYIEGSFHGSFQDGIKVNGTFHKAAEPITERKGFSHALGLVPKSFGQLCISPDAKWSVIFQQCYSAMGCDDFSKINSRKAWEKIAALVTLGKKSLADPEKTRDISRSPNSVHIPEILETIPAFSTGCLTTERYGNIKEYLNKAFETPIHPLGYMMESLVDVYRATYVGVDTHPRLLYHAVLEVKSFVARIYPVVRILFPDLPSTGEPMEICPENYTEDEFTDPEKDPVEVVSSSSLLHPLLLPKIYPALFTLYALYNEKEDERYWRRVSHWNKQSDVALMAYLGMDEMFWLVEQQAANTAIRQKLSSLRDHSYTEAVDTLQHMSTSFSPAEKLQLVQKTFDSVNKVVQAQIGLNYLWCMDDLFPVFLYVVVRARIQHLGAEIHFIDELMEQHLEHGELGIMFTTLKACYFQIQNEKLV